MKTKLIPLLILAMLVCLLPGCGDTVSEIAGNVAEAALTELENQIKKKLEENKLEVVELKTAFGALNGDGEHQFFCAALVKSEATAIPQSTADAMAKVFNDAGLLAQSGSKIQSDWLQHKSLEFKHSDFSDGSYYVIYVYQEDITENMPSLTKTK